MDFRWIFNLKIRGVDFSKMFRGFTESGRNNTTPQGKQNTFGERSERSERSDSSVRKHHLHDFEKIHGNRRKEHDNVGKTTVITRVRIFGETHGNHRKEHDNVGKTTIITRASRSLT